MDKLTTRTIADRLGYTTEAIRQWKLESYTPDVVAAELRRRASRKFVDASTLSEQAIDMQELANELDFIV